MKIKTAHIIGRALNWAVAECLLQTKVFTKGTYRDRLVYFLGDVPESVVEWFSPSTSWMAGGPIIEREQITLKPEWDGEKAYWTAISVTRFEYDRAVQSGPTPLIAAMRCYVASKMGDEVEIPEGTKL